MGKKRKQSKFEKSGVVTELSEVSKGQIAQETESAKKQPSARDDIDDIFSAVKKLPTVEKARLMRLMSRPLRLFRNPFFVIACVVSGWCVVCGCLSKYRDLSLASCDALT